MFAHGFNAHAGGRPFQEYVAGVANQHPAGAEHKRGNNERRDGVRVHPLRGDDNETRHGGADKTVEIGQDVLVSPANIERLPVGAGQ